MIVLKQSQIVDLFQEKLRRNGSCHTGTYNIADPTHFEKGSAIFGMPFSYGEQVEGQEPENIKVEWHDVTWGVEFTIFVPSLPEPLKARWSRGFEPDDFNWNEDAEPKFFEVVQDIFMHAAEPDFWDAPEVHKIYK